MCNDAVKTKEFKQFKMIVLEMNPYDLFEIKLLGEYLTPIVKTKLPESVFPLCNVIGGAIMHNWLELTYLPIIKSMGVQQAIKTLKEIEYNENISW